MIQQISTFCNISQWIDANTLSFWSIIIGLIGIITTILAIFGFKIVLPHTRKWRKEQIEDIPDAFWGYYPNKNYIQPYFTFVDTRDNNPQLLRDYFLKKVFIKDTAEPKIYCLLGDTGTGKTAALVHLYADYIHNHSAKSPYHIKILSLREDKAFEKIDEIQDKKRCILLLDAMDESPMAQNSTQRSDFDKAINEVCKNFAFVIITCRPQFFSDDKTESEKVRVQKGYEWFPYTRLRLSDFNNIQVQEYLDNVFPSKTDCHLHQKAAKLVNKNAFIAIRPLVLTYIKDIIESKNEINTTLDLYDTIVQRWIQREMMRTNPDNLEERTQLWWNLTSEIAQYIYQNRTSKYKAPNITENELISICKKQGSINFKVILSSLRIASDASPLTLFNEENIHQRTMLTRTGDLFHFSHKSFYEYFMAYRFFLYPDEIKQVYGMGFALQLFDELCLAYKKNRKHVSYYIKHEVDTEVIATALKNIGYALQVINHIKESELKYQEALKLYRQLAELNSNKYLPYVAGILNNLASLHRINNHYQEAQKEINETLNIYHQLAYRKPEQYLPNVAQTYSVLANLHLSTNNYDLAEKEYKSALDIFFKLPNEISSAYKPDVSNTLHNLGNLHRITKKYKDSEKETSIALFIRRKLAEIDPKTYLPDVAQTLHNLATLYSDTNRYKEAEERFNEALSILIKLAEKNQDAYIPNIADTMNNLATVYSDTKQYEKAEELFFKSLSIRNKLAEMNPDAYIPYVAESWFNLALIHERTNNHKKAEEEYYKSLTLRNQMAEKSPDAYLPVVARTLINLATLHFLTNNFQNAEKEYLQSLNIYQQLIEKKNYIYLPQLALTLNNLAGVYHSTNHPEAQTKYNEALAIYRQLSEKSPYTYLPYVAMTLRNIALIYSREGNICDAETAAQESLNIYRLFAEKIPDTFDQNVKAGEELLEHIQNIK